MRLKLESEAIGRHGGITGSGAKKVIGAPHIDSLEVVIREAVQNSWDAVEADSLSFGVVGSEFRGARELNLREALKEGTRGTAPVVRLPAGPLDGLLLWDKGTSGLGGGVRADRQDESRRDFVRFVYMIGDTKVQTDSLAKGGTYGFGRSSFLNASKIGTILIYTVCKHEGVRESRFIGMSWSDPDRLEGTQLTGRHWWGAPDGKHVLPVVGSEARTVAKSLGMGVFSGDELGTAIMVVAPRWSSKEEDVNAARQQALLQLSNGVLWNCWPRLLDGTIDVQIDWFGEPVAIPDPRSASRLKVFTRAFDALQKQSSAATRTSTLNCLRPIRTLGKLALAKAPFLAETPSPDRADDDLDVRDETTPLRHVAMMRGTRLVIHYVEGPAPPEGLQYAGVFMADEDTDAVYAASEPPAHDEWVKERLVGQDRTLISVTYRRVQEEVREFLGTDKGHAPDLSAGQDLGLLSDRLGDLLLGVTGDGPGTSQQGGGAGEGRRGGGGRRAMSVRLLPARRVPRDGMIELSVPVRLESASSRRQTVTLSAKAAVVVEGGTESQHPDGAAMPEVLGWQLTTDATLVEGPSIEIEVQGQRDCILRVLQPRDCGVRLMVEAS